MALYAFLLRLAEMKIRFFFENLISKLYFDLSTNDCKYH